jgi:hypothetical protein
LIVLRVPVFIRWSVTSRRYVITPVIGRSPYLGTMAGPEIPVDSRGFRTRLELRNVATPATVTGYAVSQYVVRLSDQDVAVAYVRGFDREHRVLQVAAWYLPGSHTPVQECYAGRASPHVARLPLSVQLSREQLARSLPSGPQGVVEGSSCLMGE